MREIAVTRKVHVAFILCRLPENVTAWHKFDNLLDIKVFESGEFSVYFSGCTPHSREVRVLPQNET